MILSFCLPLSVSRSVCLSLFYYLRHSSGTTIPEEGLKSEMSSAVSFFLIIKFLVKHWSCQWSIYQINNQDLYMCMSLSASVCLSVFVSRCLSVSGLSVCLCLFVAFSFTIYYKYTLHSTPLCVCSHCSVCVYMYIIYNYNNCNTKYMFSNMHTCT